MTRLRSRLALLATLLALQASGQFSPGKLSEAHAHLEGMNQCTQCHELGKAVSTTKCLDCHTEINDLRVSERGFHSSEEVRGQSCISCHSEHHGRAFNAVFFDTATFEHTRTGYELEGAHQKVSCTACHRPVHIENDDLRGRTGTYLGLETACLTCHDDYHQGTLASSCTDCHGMEQWAPAEYFDHNNSEFPLRGAHRTVDCIECHAQETRNGTDFQVFNGLAFGKCTDCHKDHHEGRLGSNCTECHNDRSWNIANIETSFNHDETRFPLVGQHAALECASCHENEVYKAQAFAACTDCHDDYHQGELLDARGKPAACDQCHRVEFPFTWSSYGIAEHQESPYPLEGAHMATPCTACHQPSQEDRWSFAFESTSCVSCHEHVHEGKMDEKWQKSEGCTACHNTIAWKSVSFDHDQTTWPLTGLHQQVSCRECHLPDGLEAQVFAGTPNQCAQCHSDTHGGQFDEPDLGMARCDRCHSTEVEWDALEFDHDATEFPLVGKHLEAACAACHPKKEENETEFIFYKIPQRTCVECHGS